MKSTKDTTHAFIVRIWIEPQNIGNTEPVWRGVIERVDNGERVYFDHLAKMNAFFAKYLEEMGIDISG